jgi:hypothetical protein
MRVYKGYFFVYHMYLNDFVYLYVYICLNISCICRSLHIYYKHVCIVFNLIQDFAPSSCLALFCVALFKNYLHKRVCRGSITTQPAKNTIGSKHAAYHPRIASPFFIAHKLLQSRLPRLIKIVKHKQPIRATRCSPLGPITALRLYV